MSDRPVDERLTALEQNHRTLSNQLQETDKTARRAEDVGNRALKATSEFSATLSQTHLAIVDHIARAVGGVKESVEKSLDRREEATMKRLDQQDEGTSKRLDEQDAVTSKRLDNVDGQLKDVVGKVAEIHEIEVRRSEREQTLEAAAKVSREKRATALKTVAWVLALPSALVGAMVAFHAIGVWLRSLWH